MHFRRSSSRIVIVTFGVRTMTSLQRPKQGTKTGPELTKSGHFYLAESGHLYLAITFLLRIMYIMLNY